MDLSLNELVVLAAARQPMPRSQLAASAGTLGQSTKFDQNVALTEIKNLEARKMLVQDRQGYLEITREGWVAVMNSLPMIEALRAAVASITYRTR